MKSLLLIPILLTPFHASQENSGYPTSNVETNFEVGEITTTNLANDSIRYSFNFKSNTNNVIALNESYIKYDNEETKYQFDNQNFIPPKSSLDLSFTINKELDTSKLTFNMYSYYIRLTNNGNEITNKTIQNNKLQLVFLEKDMPTNYYFKAFVTYKYQEQTYYEIGQHKGGNIVEIPYNSTQTLQDIIIDKVYLSLGTNMDVTEVFDTFFYTLFGAIGVFILVAILIPVIIIVVVVKKKKAKKIK